MKSAGAAALPRAGPARGRARGRGRLGLDDPRLLRAPPARPRAERGHRPRLPRARRGRGGAARRRRVRRRARGVHGTRTRTGSSWWPRTRPTGCATWCAPRTRTCAAAGERHPRLRGDAPARAGGRGRPAARTPPRAALARARPWRASGKSVDEGDRRATRGARRRCRAATRRRSARTPATSTARPTPPTPAYEVARREHRDHTLLRELLELYGERYERGKRDRSALDFEDLELRRARPAAGDEGLREAVLGALRARAGRRVPGHEPRCRTSCSSCSRARTCSGSATRTSRSTASATPT